MGRCEGSVDPVDLVNVTMERDMLEARMATLEQAAREVVRAAQPYVLDQPMGQYSKVRETIDNLEDVLLNG